MLVKDPESAAFDPKYMPNYRVTAVYGRNRIEVQDEKGNKSVRRAAHVKMCEPVDKVISQLPPQSVYEQYGRSSKLLIHPRDVPEIPLELFTGQRHHEELEKLETGIPMMVDTFEESKSQKGTCNDGNVQQEALTESSDWEGNLHGVNDTFNESKNRERCGGKANEESRKDSCVMKSTGSKPTTNDTLDESRSREQYGVREEISKEECDVNMLTTDVTQTAIDSSRRIEESNNCCEDEWKRGSP